MESSSCYRPVQSVRACQGARGGGGRGRAGERGVAECAAGHVALVPQGCRPARGDSCLCVCVHACVFSMYVCMYMYVRTVCLDGVC